LRIALLGLQFFTLEEEEEVVAAPLALAAAVEAVTAVPGLLPPGVV
jgi:hypothetical protein